MLPSGSGSSGQGRIRKLGADYLAYALIDLVVDNYFMELEKFGDQVESLEDEVVAQPLAPDLARTCTGSRMT